MILILNTSSLQIKELYKDMIMREIEIKEQILRLIKKNPRIKTSEIIDNFDEETRKILQILDELKDEGKIE